MALQPSRPTTRRSRTVPRLRHSGKALPRNDRVGGASVRSRSTAHAPPRRTSLLSIPNACPIRETPAFDLYIQYISDIYMPGAASSPISSMGIGGQSTGSRDVAFRASDLIFCVVVALAVCGARPALALDPRYPDWPCQQLKVPEIS